MERNLWKETEIKTLLTIMDEKNILDMISEKKFRNEQIFRFVESEMSSRGYSKKNFQQIWTKWKFLKSSYVTTKRHNSNSGGIPKTCDYYDLLDRILGDRMNGAGTAATVTTTDEISTPTISDVKGGVDLAIVKQEIIEEPLHDSPTPPPSPPSIIPDFPEPSMHLPPVQPQRAVTLPKRRKRIKMQSDVPETFYPDIEERENDPKKKPIQGNYLRALKELATNLRQMQRELMTEFFRKQEELMQEEHEFQRQQDEVLLKSFEEQTRLLLEGARSLLISDANSGGTDVVYINED